LLPPLGPIDIESPFESDITICISSSPRDCDSLLIEYASPIDPPRSRDLSYFEFPSDEAILYFRCLNIYEDKSQNKPISKRIIQTIHQNTEHNK
jgi:hypothetical protein